MDNKSIYKYTAYGLSISSSVPLPELYPSVREPDVKIVYGVTPVTLDEVKEEGVCYLAGDGVFLLSIEGIARFLISGGNEIIVEPYPGCDDDSLRLFLLDVAFGALLHQRGALVLHGSAIQAGEGCICLAGATGVGKSTIAGGFLKQGYRLLTDDVCPLMVKQGGIFHVLPAYPVLKLWIDSLKKLGENPAAYLPVRPVLKKYGKPVKDLFHKQPLPLTHIYVIGTSNRDGVELTPIGGRQKLSVLKSQTYRFRYIKGLKVQRNHFRHCVNLGKVAKISYLIRPKAPFMIDEIVDIIEKDFNKK